MKNSFQEAEEIKKRIKKLEHDTIDKMLRDNFKANDTKSTK